MPPRWVISEKFWIYWATTIPATAVVVILGLAWLRASTRRFPPMGEPGELNAMVESKFW
jgi:hypothetical protein